MIVENKLRAEIEQLKADKQKLYVALATYQIKLKTLWVEMQRAVISMTEMGSMKDFIEAHNPMLAREIRRIQKAEEGAGKMSHTCWKECIRVTSLENKIILTFEDE